MPSSDASRRTLERLRCEGRIRLRHTSEASAVLKLAIWQAAFSEPRPSQRGVARRLGISQPYVCRIMQRAPYEGFSSLVDWRLRYGPLNDADIDRVLDSSHRILAQLERETEYRVSR